MNLTRCAALVVVVSVCAWASPVPQQSSHRQQNSLTKNKQARSKHWWDNPCGIPTAYARVPDTPRGTEMPIEVASLEESDVKISWLIKLRTAIEHLRTIEQFYANVTEYKRFNHHWLPNEKFLGSQPPPKQPVKLIIHLYKGLQRFAVTIECMLNGPDCKHKHKVAEVHDETRRKVLSEIKKELRALLCEVKSLIEHLSKRVPRAPTSVIIDTLQWLTKPDKTLQSIQDWGVLNKYLAYLLKWESGAESIVSRLKSSSGRRRKTTTTTESSQADRDAVTAAPRRSKTGRKHKKPRQES